MAINRISGNILQDDLVRGNDLAFQGNLVYINVTDTRVGINTASTTHTLTVVGNTNISGDFFAGDIYTDGIDANLITANSIIAGNLEIPGNVVVDSLTANNFVQADDFLLANNTISLTVSGNITLIPTGNNLFTIQTESAMILPSGNTAARPSSPVAGSFRYSTDSSGVEFYDGTTWQTLATAIITNQILTGDGSSVNFTLDKGSTNAAALISINGVVQVPGTAYSISGNILTFAEAPLTTDTVDVRFL